MCTSGGNGLCVRDAYECIVDRPNKRYREVVARLCNVSSSVRDGELRRWYLVCQEPANLKDFSDA